MSLPQPDTPLGIRHLRVSLLPSPHSTVGSLVSPPQTQQGSPSTAARAGSQRALSPLLPPGEIHLPWGSCLHSSLAPTPVSPVRDTVDRDMS